MLVYECLDLTHGVLGYRIHFHCISVFVVTKLQSRFTKEINLFTFVRKFHS